jgi:hypothetical protein
LNPQNDAKLFEILGGRKAMIESPLLDELKAEWTREATRNNIVRILTTRFGVKDDKLQVALEAVDDNERLGDLLEHAARCRNLESFRKRLGLQARGTRGHE